MRIAVSAAISAACLVVSVAPAIAADTSVISSTGDQVASFGGQGTPGIEMMNQSFRLYATASASKDKGLRDMVDQSHHLRFEHKLLEYYPIANSNLHLFFGFQKDRRDANSRSFNVRGERMFDATATGYKRKLAPGLGVDYDQPLDAHDKLSLDAGMRLSRDPNAARLVRLAGADESKSLGAHSARFGPSAHLSFIHSF